MKTSERLNLHQQNHSKPINKITVKSVMNGKASMNNVVIDETEKTTGNDLTDEESLLKLKLILKTISVSSFYYNKTVLSKKSFENLVKLQNYENTLNCKLQTCLYEVHDINDYLLKEIDKNDIKTILNRYSSDSHIAGLGSTLNYDKTASHTEKQFSHNEIQSDPYYYNEHSSDGINSIRRSRHPKKMLNKKISTNQTLNEEIKSCNCANNSCLNLKKVDASSSPNHDSTDSKTQLFKSDVPLNSSHYCVNSGNKIVENENEKQKEVYNRNLNVLRDRNKILPEEKSIIKSKSLLNISSSKSKIDRTKIPPVLGLAQDQLSNEANDCQRNHTRRNAICNPYHIPLKEGTRQMYEHNLRLSEAYLRNQLYARHALNNDDHDPYIIKDQNKSSIFVKLFECFRQNKINNLDPIQG